MPNAPLRVCSYPGCTVLVVSGRCELHGRHVSTHAALYDTARWKSARKAFLAQHPFCECPRCRGENPYMIATVVDHIIPPVRGDALAFWNRNNWQALHAVCHGVKTGRESQAKRKAWERQYR